MTVPHAIPTISHEQGRAIRVSSLRRRRWGVGIALVVMLGCLAAVTSVQAQSFSATDLEGTWQVSQLATPRGVLTGADVRSYSGEVSFDSTGVVTGVSILADDTGVNSYTVSGNLSVSTGGLVSGTLLLTGVDPGTSSGTLVVREARLLTTRFTMVGAATVLGQVGLFTFVKRDDTQTFTQADDLGGDWDYHELTPSTNMAASFMFMPTARPISTTMTAPRRKPLPMMAKDQ